MHILEILGSHALCQSHGMYVFKMDPVTQQSSHIQKYQAFILSLSVWGDSGPSTEFASQVFYLFFYLFKFSSHQTQSSNSSRDLFVVSKEHFLFSILVLLCTN